MIYALPNSNYVSLNMSMAHDSIILWLLSVIIWNRIDTKCKSLAGYSYMAYIVLIYSYQSDHKIGKCFEGNSSCTQMVLHVKKSGHVP